eukprot:CAMPEP_0181294242 /NCGR_PEP_ID=MMETSP1101-20121128/3491_1 /TAXON_ID=46948 /ORGANISM="Rhodomonas abbreviata, Strain Caron Lab Isolate" /LENGTH=336 /DNA_ID=CAMNT_0023398877 /DNA_START=351 /DNA_END=1361 /DNA_ORIENTATION=+
MDLQPARLLSSVNPSANHSKAELLAAVRLLCDGIDPPTAPDPKRRRISLAQHCSRFTPNGQQWLEIIKIYMAAVQGDKVKYSKLLQMTEIPSQEATLSKYFVGKILGCPEATASLRIRMDLIKSAWYWIAAAQEGFAFAICGLANLLREPLPGLTVDLASAKKLWAKAYSLCDVPEAANEIGFCFGTGQGGPVDLVKAAAWYDAAKNCDIDGTRIGDKPRGGHGDLTSLFELGPSDDLQSEFVQRATRNYYRVRKDMGVNDPSAHAAALRTKGHSSIARVLELTDPGRTPSFRTMDDGFNAFAELQAQISMAERELQLMGIGGGLRQGGYGRKKKK